MRKRAVENIVLSLSLVAFAVTGLVADEIYTIPADSTVYNVTNVEVFGSTDDEAYVGYYPGYYGSYVYGTVKFGIPIASLRSYDLRVSTQ